VGVKDIIELINGKLTTVKRTVFKEKRYFISVVGVEKDGVFWRAVHNIEPKNH